MDVTCPRCQTDYEFDDALVSERGTTVKCTNCGHQFRVFRPKTSGGTPTTTNQEVWRIDRREGEPLELRSLVELQRAIRAGRVGREDQLRKGDGVLRRVGDIPELEPFFPSPPTENAPKTLPLPYVGDHPASGAPAASQRAPQHTPAWGRGFDDFSADLAKQAEAASSKPLSAPPPGRLPPPRTPPPPRYGAAHEDKDEDASLDALARKLNAAAQEDPEPPTRRRPPPPRAAAETSPPARFGATPAKDRQGKDRQDPTNDRDHEPSNGNEHRDVTGPSHPSLPGLPKRSGAVIVVAAVAAVAVGAGLFFTRSMWQKSGNGAPSGSTSTAGAPKVERELAAGDRAKAEGDFMASRDAYLRATLVEEKSLAAWDGLCTAESEIAVTRWIAAMQTGSSFEREQANLLGGAATRTCARWSELARATEEGAKLVASDLRVARALAAQGDAPGVRLYLSGRANDPVLEALVGFADASKKDAAAIAIAAKTSATGLGKADPASLPSPADVALAAFSASLTGNTSRRDDLLTELARRAPKHMLTDLLRGKVTTLDAGVVDVGPPDVGTVPTSTPTTPPTGPITPSTASPPSTGPGPTTPATDTSGDYRALNERAHKALAGGDVAKAQALYNAALGQKPGDIDALYGLGQIARSKGDQAGAAKYFQQCLDGSPGYAPARIALADAQWSLGQQDEAKKNYQAYLDRISEGSSADRARTRLGLEKKVDPPPGDP